MEYTYHYNSPLGGITLAGCEDGLTGLWFDGQKYFAATLSKQHEEKHIPVFDEAIRWLDIYFGGKESDFTPPLKLSGTPFRRAVWDILLTIPYGHTMTYGELSDIMAKQKCVSKIVPCHRVVGAGGNLTGYAGGTDKKLRLLKLEGADISSLYIPVKGTAL